jgi:hypothetical protein
LPSRRFRTTCGQAAAPAIAIAVAAGLLLAHAAAQEATPDGADLGLRGATQPLDEAPTSDIGLPPVSSDSGSTGNGNDTDNAGAANYGKPKPPDDPTKRYKGQPKTFVNPLPALVPYPTSAAARQSGATADPQGVPGPTIATVPPIPQKPKPKVDADPFAPVGIEIGSLRLVPYVEFDSGYDSNPNQQSGPTVVCSCGLVSGAVRGSPTLRGETGFTLQSDWSVHQLTGELHAGYTDDVEVPQASSPDGNGKFDLRLDATHDTAIDLEARGTLATQQAGSPILGTASVSAQPLVTTLGGTAGVTQKFGDASLGLHGTIDRTDYADATLSNGSTLALSDDSFTAYGLQTRAGYQLTPGVMPFLEVDVDTRQHDQRLDTSGFARDSNGQAALAGTTFELTRILTGEIDGGYAQREYADPRLANLQGPTFDSSLVWSATPLTTVTLKATTTLAETTVAYASGAMSRTISLELAHQLFTNLKLHAVASYGTDTYQGVSLFDRTYAGTFKAEYALSRSIVLKASVSQQRFHSTAAGSDYTESKFMLGLKLQR